MKKTGRIIFLLLIALTFMQAGASLFAITVNISSLIEAPPASLTNAQGPYAFNPDIFWEKFPPLVFLTLLLALILNWKTYLRKWIISGGVIWVLSGFVAIVLLGPVQTEFLSTDYSDTVNPNLRKLGELWRNYSLLFMALSALSGIVYLLGISRLADR
ncbi:hypothetical protein [Mangrovivirga cuniculi]|uniref:DUF1772 domain-containing protein n=1 Tax=Mangrovivirga cuniculi TaxID=2715131 RepID=A0A4D7JLG1_9BACT|nr:hypothetical protein [Mangrovivirga cuniculi]QCK15733.1 hypothetical protein DCC35_13765 [Mangrovivirga cuniculi]